MTSSAENSESAAVNGLHSKRKPVDPAHQRQIQQRQLARQLAVQVLFEVDVVGHKPGDVVDARLANPMPSEAGDDPQVQVGEDASRYLRWLVSGVTTQRTELDRIIGKYAPEWPVDQLAVIDRTILRLALFEIGCRDADTPPKVVINEAVELAKRFGSDNSPRFVNGVLGSALDEVQRKLF